MNNERWCLVARRSSRTYFQDVTALRNVLNGLYRFFRHAARTA